MKLNNNRIENDISKTAEMICCIRAASFYEKDLRYKSNDYIAPCLLPALIKPLIRLKIITRLLANKIIPRGIYEYVIARTKYIDEITEKAIQDGFQQVFIFGAGFDSRAIRYNKRNIAFFESDAVNTQEAKINQYKKRKIQIPDNLVFIPVNFNNEKITDKIRESKFDKNKKTLFILEGLTLYIQPVAVEELIKLIKDNSNKKNWILVDFIYKSVLDKENKYYGERNVYDRVAKYNETWTFGIDDNNIKKFFGDRKLNIIELADSKKLEEKYFNNHNPNKNLINGTHCLAWLETT